MSDAKKEAKRQGVMLWGGLAALLLAAGSLTLLSKQSDVEVKYDDSVIMMCTYELANGKYSFIITDQKRQKCEDGTVSVWKKALTVHVGGIEQRIRSEELAWKKAKAEHPSLTEEQHEEFILRLRRKSATKVQQEGYR